MAFDSDDEKARAANARKRDSDADGGGLGALEAGLPGRERPEEAEESIDASALAALSKGQPSQKTGADDAEGARVQLAGAAALATERSSSRPPPAATTPASVARPQPSAAGRWVVPLLVGFGLGIPTGGWLFSSEAPSREAPAATHAVTPPPPPSAAEIRAQAADEAAAAVRLPVVSQPEQAAPAAPAAEAPAEGALQPLAATAKRPSDARAAEPTAPAAAPGPAAPGPRPAVKSSAAAPAPAAPPAVAAAAPSTPAAAPAAPAQDAPPATPAAPAVPPGQPDPRSVDQLLDDALASSNARKAQEEADRALTPPSIPATPSRDDVTRAMTVLLPAIRGCAAGQSGLATVGIVVKNDGRVESVAVTGAPFEGQRSGRCMEGVVRRAKFPRFQQPSFRVQFPFAIQ